MNTKDINITLAGLKKHTIITLDDCLVLKSTNLDDMNSLTESNNIAPQKTSARIEGNVVKISTKPLSFALYKIKL